MPVVMAQQYIQLKSNVLDEDLRLVAASRLIDWERLRGRTILVTGSTGFIGSLIVKSLLYANELLKLGITILADIRDKSKADLIFREFIHHPNLMFTYNGVHSPEKITCHVDYIIHTVSITSSKLMAECPYETIAVTLHGTENMLQVARANNISGMVYLSSMEVYGIPEALDYEMTEDKMGYLNPLLPRNSYPESKRMAEGLCASAAFEFGVPVRIARLAQTFGPGISPEENRVFAQFARAILTGNDIVLKTDGLKSHCYCYSRDAIIALLMLLTKGSIGQAYNISNEASFCSIREMAERLIASYPESGSKVICKIPQDSSKSIYPPSSKMKILSDKMRALGWSPQVELDEMYNRLISYMSILADNR